jgi:hypothetical protein
MFCNIRPSVTRRHFCIQRRFEETYKPSQITSRQVRGNLSSAVPYQIRFARRNFDPSLLVCVPTPRQTLRQVHKGDKHRYHSDKH